MVDTKWAHLFPDGRFIFYEGNEPKAFVAEVKRKFGFDPGKDEGWGKWIEMDDGRGFYSYGFHCPAKHLDAIYGRDKYLMGS